MMPFPVPESKIHKLQNIRSNHGIETKYVNPQILLRKQMQSRIYDTKTDLTKTQKQMS